MPVDHLACSMGRWQEQKADTGDLEALPGPSPALTLTAPDHSSVLLAVGPQANPKPQRDLSTSSKAVSSNTAF